MSKCILLEYSDGHIETRGGFSGVALASFLLVLRGKDRPESRRELGVKEAAALLAGATGQELEDARDLGLELVLRDYVPTQNPDAISAEIVDVAFPPDRIFRSAWEKTVGAIRVNLPKACIIHMDRIRESRNVELEKLDVPFMRAVEAGDTVEQQRIAGLKEGLRQIPQAFDLSGYITAEQLHAAWPVELPARES
jgi:hypothetical protein